LFSPEETTRILGVAQGSTMALQMGRVMGGRVEHAATTACLLRDAWLCGGHVVLPTCTHRVGTRALPWFSDAGAPTLGSAALASTAYGVRFFGHWMLDDLPLMLAAGQFGQLVDVIADRSPHQFEYQRLLGLSTQTCLDARVRELVVLDDIGQNEYKAARLEELRRRMIEPLAPSSHAGVMVLRKDTGVSRRLTNEMDIAQRLSAQGFTIVSPMESSVDDMVKVFTGAKVVVGVEGSHLTHALLCMPPGSTLVTIQPPERFDAVLKDWCDCKGVRYGFVVGEPATDGFSVSHEKLDQLLQMVS
jgi:capsular polysaccharide biosynthesis protein